MSDFRIFAAFSTSDYFSLASISTDTSYIEPKIIFLLNYYLFNFFLL